MKDPVSRLTRRANPSNVDPNCVNPTEALEYPWGRLLSRHAQHAAAASAAASSSSDCLRIDPADAAGGDEDAVAEGGGVGSAGRGVPGSSRTGDDDVSRGGGLRRGGRRLSRAPHIQERRWRRAGFCLHVDIHGRRDPGVSGHEIGFSDCDLGVAALIASERQRAAVNRRERQRARDDRTKNDAASLPAPGGGEGTGAGMRGEDGSSGDDECADTCGEDATPYDIVAGAEENVSDPRAHAPAATVSDDDVSDDINRGGDETVGHALRRVLARRIRAFFASWRAPRGGYLPEGESFVVSEDPVLTGMRADGRMTMSQQGVALGRAAALVESTCWR